MSRHYFVTLRLGMVHADSKEEAYERAEELLYDLPDKMTYRTPDMDVQAEDECPDEEGYC
jgi:hypothetical protein